MRRRVAIAVTSAVLMFASVNTAAAVEFESDRNWIVTLVPGQDIRGLARALTANVGGELGFVYEHTLGGFSFRGSPVLARALEMNPAVSSVTEEITFTLEDSAGLGIFRMAADEAHQLDGGAYRGAGIRIAVIDSGIDLDHSDLSPNLDVASGKNCVNPSPPDDDHGHGTHVAGIAAAALNGSGVAGVAPEATLIPVKVFDGNGNATTSQVLCGIEHVAAIAGDGVTIANMSFGEQGSDSACDDVDTSDVLHEAICDMADAGVIPVAAAGNSSTDTATFIPAAFPEVITVSALTDYDGTAGGLAGCNFDLTIGYDCDDNHAIYSNFGAAVDIMAPGTRIYSTLPGGGFGVKSGTSMAAPHIAGLVAAMLSANQSMTTDQIRHVIQISGECPDPAGAANLSGGATCVDQGLWPGDPDGIAEPLANALSAVQAVVDLGPGPVDFSPTAEFAATCEGLACDFTDTSTDFEGPVASWSWDFGDGTASTVPSPSHAYAVEGVYTVQLTVTDGGGNSDTTSQQVQVPPPFSPSVQGDWVGVFGADGYVLGAWNGGSDAVSFPFGTVSLDQGSRAVWSSSTGDVRALESSDESERRATTFWHASQIRVSLDFTADYVGELHLYAVDWDSTARRQVVTVDDGSGPQTVDIDAAFGNGAWMHFPVDVTAGATVTITVDRTAGANAVLSGIFLGD